MVKGGVTMQNYAYNRNAMQNSENLRYRSSYVRRPRSSASYTILRALVRIFLSDTAILTYKIAALLFTVAIVLGTVGAAESGILAVPVAFSLCLIVLSSACYLLYRKYGLDG